MATVRGWVLLMAMSAACAAARAGDPLHVEIDRLLDAAQIGPVAEVVNDAEFLRRLTLDLAGTIPTADEVRRFVADKDPEKRRKAVDRLLDSERHVRRMVEWLDAWLMERRPYRWVPEAEFQAFLLGFYRANRPYRDLIGEILRCDAGDPGKRGPARFLMDREVDSNVVTRDVSRLFFGRDIQCAQCHDHPNVDDYFQSEFQGMAAFLNRSYLFTIDENMRKAAIGEKAESDPTYTSVFQPASRFTAAPHLPGEVSPPEPAVEKGKEYRTKPDAKNRGVPTFSRRELLASIASKGENLWFNRNIANRLWALMMGRGIVHPPDFQHADNPPSNPELLDLLARRFAESGHNIRNFLREIALTRAYQRSIDMPENVESYHELAAAQIPRLEEEERAAKARSASQQKIVNDLRGAIRLEDKKLGAARKALETAQNAAAEAEKAFAAARKPLTDAQSQMTASESSIKSLNEAAAKAQEAAKLAQADKELAQAVAVLQAKAKQASDAADAARQTIAKFKMPPDVEQKLAEAKKNAETAAQQVSSLEQGLVPMRNKLVGEMNALGGLKTSWRHAERRLAAARSYLDYCRLSREWFAKRDPLEKARTDHAAAEERERRARFEAEIAVRQRDAAGQSLEKAKQELAAARQRSSERGNELGMLMAKLDPAESAIRTLAQVAAVAPSSAGEKPPSAPSTEAVAALQQLRIEVGRASARKGRSDLAVRAAEEAVTKGEAALASAAAQLAARGQTLAAREAESRQALNTVQRLHAPLAQLESAWEAARTAMVENWTTFHAVAALKPLTPEQLGWSVLQATGITDNYRSQAVADMLKPPTPPDSKAAPPAQSPPQPPAAPPPGPPSLDRVEEWVYNKLKPSTVEFIRLFGASPGSPQDVFIAAPDQALFVANGGSINNWLEIHGENVTGRALKQTEPQGVAEEIYLSVLGRWPTPAETEEVKDILSRNPHDRKSAVQQLAWSLLASIEFRFNH